MPSALFSTLAMGVRERPPVILQSFLYNPIDKFYRTCYNIRENRVFPKGAVPSAMKKSTYCLVLADRVVDEVDRLAYRRGISRSALINEILAESLSLTTPEKRNSDIFGEIAALLYPGEIFRELAPPTRSVMSMRSALTYKYNPTVRYTVELFRDLTLFPGGEQGVLRVSVRSTSQALLAELHRFYRLWAGVERRFGFPADLSVEEHTLCRPIIPRPSPCADRMSGMNAGHTAPEERGHHGASLAAFISLMDTGMKLCLREPEDGAALAGMSDLYADYVRSNREVV